MAGGTVAWMPSLHSLGGSCGSYFVEDKDCMKQWTQSVEGKRRDMSTSFEGLGEDLLVKILQHANPSARELCRYAGVNKTWNQLAYSSMFWQKLSIGQHNMQEGLERVAGRCTGLIELHIEDPLCELHILHPIIVACGNSLRKISLDCDKDTTSRNEASICSILWIISLYCKHVDSIELLSDGREATMSCLENKAMWYLTSGFRNIRNFTCLCQNSITKQAMYLMVIAWRDLSSLRIHCGGLQMDDLMALRKCYTLRHLEIVGGQPGLVVPQPWGAVMHAELESITFTDSSCSAQDVMLLAGLCPNLKSVIVNLSNCELHLSLEQAATENALKALRGNLGVLSVDIR